MTALRRLLPGLVLLGAAGLAARALAGAVPVLTPLVLAIAIGAIVANTVGVPGWSRAGVAKHPLLLETAIVLLGASLSLEAVLAAGPLLVVLVVATVTFGVLVVGKLSRLASLGDRMGTLLAAGSSICGVSAIAAVAPAVDADEAQIAHAAATILIFDAVTLVAFPAIGRFLELAPRTYGVWIGLSMFSTGPVAAAGFAHSAVAGRWATLTKLARNTMIGVVAVSYSLHYARRGLGTRPTPGRVWTEFPKFLVGFVLLAALTTAGLVPDAVVDSLSRTADALFLLAFVGLGFEIRLDDMRTAGTLPVVVVSAYLLLVSALTYLLVTLWL